MQSGTMSDLAQEFRVRRIDLNQFIQHDLCLRITIKDSPSILPSQA